MTDTPPDAYTGFVLHGPRRARALSDDALGAALEGEALAWAHLPFDPAIPARAEAWLARHVSGLDETTRRAMLGTFTRPRALGTGRGLMVVLRGVNLNPGEDVEDMVSVRIYMDARRIVTLSRRPLRSIAALSERIEAGQGPETPGAFLHDLAQELMLRIEDVLDRLEDDTDVLEDRIDAGDLDRDAAESARSEAMRLRRVVLGLRRHLAPQRDAIAGASAHVPDLVPKPDRRRLAEIQDRHLRAVEELDELSARLTLVRDEIRAEMDERTNRNLYLLSILSALFLPLSFLTGLLGVNLGGIPGAAHPLGFAAFVAILTGVLVLQVVLLRRLRRL